MAKQYLHWFSDGDPARATIVCADGHVLINNVPQAQKQEFVDLMTGWFNDSENLEAFTTADVKGFLSQHYKQIQAVPPIFSLEPVAPVEGQTPDGDTVETMPDDQRAQLVAQLGIDTAGMTPQEVTASILVRLNAEFPDEQTDGGFNPLSLINPLNLFGGLNGLVAVGITQLYNAEKGNLDAAIDRTTPNGELEAAAEKKLGITNPDSQAAINEAAKDVGNALGTALKAIADAAAKVA